jgi:hypothetical protein
MADRKKLAGFAMSWLRLSDQGEVARDLQRRMRREHRRRDLFQHRLARTQLACPSLETLARHRHRKAVRAAGIAVNCMEHQAD